MDGLDRYIRSIHIIRTIRNLHLPFLTLTLTSLLPLLLLPFLLLLLPLLLIILLLVGCLSQIALIMCIEMLILKISLQEFLDRPTIWKLM
jgi:hypothetical protein